MSACFPLFSQCDRSCWLSWKCQRCQSVLMLHQWVFLAWQHSNNLYDLIYANEPSAIDHQLARATQTFMHSGWGTVDGGAAAECLDTALYQMEGLSIDWLITCLSRLSQEASVCFNYSSPSLPQASSRSSPLLRACVCVCMCAHARERGINVLDARYDEVDTFLILKLNLSFYSKREISEML